MSATYTTITAKGQITLPAAARRKLNLRPGQKVAVRVIDGHLEIEPPTHISAIRETLRAEAEKKGTWGAEPEGGAGWLAQAESRVDKR